MVTIHDVARKAGVAPITVSRVINNAGYASQATRQRVEAAIAELGFVPNTLARSLRSKRTNTLALVLSDITNPFFTTLARGVEDAARSTGFTVIFCNTDESEEKEQKYLQVLLQKRVDGILLVPAHGNPDAVQFLQDHNTPVVIIDRCVPSARTDVVRCDSEKGAYLLVQLLVKLGHTHIAVLGGPQGVSTADDRVAGARRAMSEARLNPQNLVIFHGAFTQASGYEMTRQALAAESRPTALFASNNFIAIGAMKALRDLDQRVPEDIAVVAFDDLPAALVIFPFLTVAAQPAYEMGQKATELLVNHLIERSSSGFREIILPVEIIVRQSSGMARLPEAQTPFKPD